MKKSNSHKFKNEELYILNDMSENNIQIIENLNEYFYKTFNLDVKIEKLTRFVKGDLYTPI